MDFLNELLLFLHILLAIVGFGSTFVWPALASKARALGPEKGYALTHASGELSPYLSSYPIYGVGVTGILLGIFLYFIKIFFQGTFQLLAFFKKFTSLFAVSGRRHRVLPFYLN